MTPRDRTSQFWVIASVVGVVLLAAGVWILRVGPGGTAVGEGAPAGLDPEDPGSGIDQANAELSVSPAVEAELREAMSSAQADQPTLQHVAIHLDRGQAPEVLPADVSGQLTAWNGTLEEEAAFLEGECRHTDGCVTRSERGGRTFVAMTGAIPSYVQALVEIEPGTIASLVLFNKNGAPRPVDVSAEHALDLLDAVVAAYRPSG